MPPNQDTAKHPIIYFDGVCNLCNGFVQFVLKRDKKGLFRFASLQSDYAKSRGFEIPSQPDGDSGSLLVEWDGKLLKYSTGALYVFGGLGGGYRLLKVLLIVPRFIRDAVYKWIAHHRYAIFGKRESCMLPAPEWEGRFLG
jgi:predicted DCC family thiol-disulfide oxidoreductase YuxK